MIKRLRQCNCSLFELLTQENYEGPTMNFMRSAHLFMKGENEAAIRIAETLCKHYQLNVEYSMYLVALYYAANRKPEAEMEVHRFSKARKLDREYLELINELDINLICT